MQQIEPNLTETGAQGYKQTIMIHGKKVFPHTSVNAMKLQEQMERNPEVWKTMFGILESTTFSGMEPGRHEVMGENL
jgi:hypothetical protein